MSLSVLSNSAARILVRRERAVASVVYCSYGDESRDEHGQLVYAVAALFGHQNDWDALEVAWTERTGGKVFHAADCDSDNGEFSNTSHRENKKLYADLTKLIAASRICGRGVAIDVQDYKRAFPKDLEHSPYLIGFLDVVEKAADFAFLSTPPEPIRIVFDRNADLEYSATELYNLALRMKRIPTRFGLHGEISFACRRTPGIQAADLFAREVMKRLEACIGPKRRPARQSFLALLETRRFWYREFNRDFWERAKMKLPQAARHALTIDSYQQWLAEGGNVDSLPNRVKYLSKTPNLLDGK